jgi:hypothetical protein
MCAPPSGWSRRGLRDSQWLFLVRRAHRFAGGDSTETAGAGANVAENHESGGAMLPAFPHVGAARGFADGVEIEGAHGALEMLVALAAKELDLQPIGARMRGGRRDEWRGAVGNDVER